jgi:hypothetical protein
LMLPFKRIKIKKIFGQKDQNEKKENKGLKWM